MLTSLDIGIIVVYLVLMVGLGFILGRHENADGFFVNNRKTRLFLLIFTALSTSIGSGSIIGVAAAAYTTGISFGVSFAIASLISWFFLAWLAPRIKEQGDKLKAYTFGDFLAARYANKVRKIGVVVILVSYFTVTAVQFVAFASIAELIGGLSFEIALLIAAFITILYTVLAGIKGDFYTDALQFFVMLPIFFILFYAGTKLMSVKEVFVSLPAEFLNPTNYAGTTFFVASIVFGFVLLLVSMEVWQRIFAAFDAKTARRAFVFSGLLKVAAVLCAIFFGLMAFHLVPGVEKDSALFSLMAHVLPPGLLGLGFASVLAILMSTVDSMLMVGSATLTKDYYLVKNPQANEKQILKMGRLFVLLFGLGAFAVAMLVQDIVRLSLTSIQMLTIFAPALLGGLLWKKSSTAGAFWSITVGFVLTLILLPFMPDTAVVPALLVSIIIFVVLSLRDSKRVKRLESTGDLGS